MGTAVFEKDQALTARQRMLVAATLFSMFFGAGNLILPPLLGLQAAAQTPWAMAGFLLSSIGLPVLGIVAVALAGNLRSLANRVHPLFSAIFVALVYLSIGPFLAIPRTSSTSFEMIGPLLPQGISLGTAQLVFSVVFFALAFVLALHPGQLTKVLGKVCAPALIVLIAAVVLAAIFMPASPATTTTGVYVKGAAIQGFLSGYQTMDLLAALNFGLVIAMNVRSMGVESDAAKAREISIAGIGAGVLMLLIYCGLAYTGYAAGGLAEGAQNGAAVLSASAAAHFGAPGTIVVALIFFIACLNVCTGLVSCCSEYFSEIIPQVSYRVWAAVFAIFSCVVSNAGLDAILTFSVPLLSALYPVAIVLVIMGLAHRFCDTYPGLWAWVVAPTAAVSVITALRDGFAPQIGLMLDDLPLAALGMGWVPFAVVGLVVGLGLGWLRRSRTIEDKVGVTPEEA